MTKKQFEDKCNQLIKQAEKHLKSRIDKALKTGAFDLDRYENNFVLPRIWIYAALTECAWQFKPLHKEETETAQNLYLWL